MPNNDYILRSDAVTLISQLPAYHGSDGAWVNQKDALDTLNVIPAADVGPVKHGRWVGMREYCQHLYDTTGERYTMSQLGISLPHCTQCWAENESRKPFCPNCGAEMDAELPEEERDD